MSLKRLGSLVCCLLLLSMLFTPALADEETVTWRSITVSKDAEEVDLGKTAVQDWNAFYAFLGQLPNLKKVDMFNNVLNLKVSGVQVGETAGAARMTGTVSGEFAATAVHM